MSSTLKKVSRRASQFLRGEAVSDDDRYLNVLHLIRKRSRKTLATQQFTIVPDIPKQDGVPQLPEMSELGKRSLKKAKSIVVLSDNVFKTSANLQPESIGQIRSSISVPDLAQSKAKVPGAFPDSSSPVDHALSDYQSKNESTNTVIRIQPASLKACSNHSANTSIDVTTDLEGQPHILINPHSNDAAELGTNASMWITTTRQSSRLETPIVSQRGEKGKAKARDYPYTTDEQWGNITPSASATASVQQLPPHRMLRHQFRLLSQRRWISIDEQSLTTEKELDEQAGLRHQFHLCSKPSRSKPQWGDLSSNFSPNNSGDLMQLRKDLRLPSHRVSTPDVWDLRRLQERVAGLSEQPRGFCGDSFFDTRGVQERISSGDNHEQEGFGEIELGQEQATQGVFQSTQPADLPKQHRAVIDNLYAAVKRVDIEMARVQLENRQLLRSEEEANYRATFLEEQLRGLQDAMSERQREKAEIIKLLEERDIPVPQRLLKDCNESGVENVPEEGDENIYDTDVLDNTTMEADEDTMEMQQGNAVQSGSQVKVK